MSKSKEFWNRMASKYESVNSIYEEVYDKTVESTKKHLKDTDIVLDFGCGTGITTIELAESVKKIHAIDISENMIEIAKRKSEERGLLNIQFDTINIYDEKLEKDSFDVIMAFNILYLIGDIDNTIQRINELLKPNGLFITVTDCLGEKITFITLIQSILSKIRVIPYIKRFKISELERIVEAGDFKVLETQNLYDSPPNYFIVARKK